MLPVALKMYGAVPPTADAVIVEVPPKQGIGVDVRWRTIGSG